MLESSGGGGGGGVGIVYPRVSSGSLGLDEQASASFLLQPFDASSLDIKQVSQIEGLVFGDLWIRIRKV